MGLEGDLAARSNNHCELCGSEKQLNTYLVPPHTSASIDNCIFLCETCTNQVEEKVAMDTNHWRCLNDSMWSETEAVKVVAWRMLNRLKAEGWPQDLLDMMYLEEETLKIAQATGDHLDEDTPKHRDINGAELKAGDTVVLIKDLSVKGASFTAKRGTAVRNIALDHENPAQIEGRVNGQHIVISCMYVKKSS